jgi:ABC-type nitrate/sulfonate/bicarbonate transport system substrate-binding protein
MCHRASARATIDASLRASHASLRRDAGLLFLGTGAAAPSTRRSCSAILVSLGRGALNAPAPALLASQPAALRAFLAASAEGFATAAAEPRAAADALRAEARHASLADAEFVRASVAAAAPAFLDAAGAWGRMCPQRWEDFIAFLEREGLLLADRGGAPLPPAHRPTAARISTNDFLPA